MYLLGMHDVKPLVRMSRKVNAFVLLGQTVEDDESAGIFIICAKLEALYGTVPPFTG